MNSYASTTTFEPPTDSSTPMILGNLPDPAIRTRACPRRTATDIDLILLAIESIELGGSEAILTFAQELELNQVIRNRVNLWRMRAANPLRKAHTRRPLTTMEAKCLVEIGRAHV